MEYLYKNIEEMDFDSFTKIVDGMAEEDFDTLQENILYKNRHELYIKMLEEKLQNTKDNNEKEELENYIRSFQEDILESSREIEKICGEYMIDFTKNIGD